MTDVTSEKAQTHTKILTEEFRKVNTIKVGRKIIIITR